MQLRASSGSTIAMSEHTQHLERPKRHTQESLAFALVTNSGQDDCVRVHSSKESGKRNGSSSREIHIDGIGRKVGAQR